MKKLLFGATMPLFLLLCVLVPIAPKLSNVGSSQRLPELESKFMPGKVLPGNLICRRYYPEYDTQCVIEDRIWITAKRGIIVKTSLILVNDNVMIGELIAAYGTPEGANYFGYKSVRVFWDKIEALVFINRAPFNAYSKVSLLTFRLNGAIVDRWRGFIDSNP